MDETQALGAFMQQVPDSVFIGVHVVLALVGVWLWRGTKVSAFLLFVVAEVLYLLYHLHALDFHFAHTLAEVCDVLAFIMVGLRLKGPSTSPS